MGPPPPGDLETEEIELPQGDNTALWLALGVFAAATLALSVSAGAIMALLVP